MSVRTFSALTAAEWNTVFALDTREDDDDVVDDDDDVVDDDDDDAI